MPLDPEACYGALVARDARFDGLFFVAVKTTRIYCRPVCPARTPTRSSCRFFEVAAAAENEGFRPCLRCRPELAPGCAPIDDSARIAARIATRLETAAEDGEEGGMERIADEFEIGTRQLRRIVQREFGVSPMDLVRTRRLLLAKQLLTETSMRVIDVAFASGFASLRRFNDAFVRHYRMPPTVLRRRTREGSATESANESETLTLAYRPPFAWVAFLDAMRRCAIPGIESVGDDEYRRTLAIGDHAGWFRLRNVPERNRLEAEVASTLLPVAHQLMARLRTLADTRANPAVIEATLGTDALLASRVSARPGLRLHGCVDGFEAALRVMLARRGKALAAIAAECGAPIATPWADDARLFPTVTRMARTPADLLVRCGVEAPQAESIRSLARAVAEGRIDVSPAADREPLARDFAALPNVTALEAERIAARVTAWPDAFDALDSAMRRALGGVSARAAEERSRAWSPWRAYAALHLVG